MAAGSHYRKSVNIVYLENDRSYRLNFGVYTHVFRVSASNEDVKVTFQCTLHSQIQDGCRQPLSEISKYGIT
jgi:hypothetical protein